MNITTALKVAKAQRDGSDQGFTIGDLQKAFDRLSQPDQAHSLQASDLRSVLWNTNQVSLDD